MLLTAGVAVGLTLFCPGLRTNNLTEVQDWRELAFSAIAGLAVPAPLFCLRCRFRGRPLGAGGLFALSMGLGVWLLLPAAVIEFIKQMRSPDVDHYEAASCLYYAMPMIGLWYLLGSLISGHLDRNLFGPRIPWIERYGFSQAVLWSPLGVWHVIDVYLAVL
jgi:hypothetical protein